MAKTDTTLTVRIEPDPEFEKIAADIQSAAKAIREMYTSVKETVDALELTLKKFNTEAIGICELCQQPGYRSGMTWMHTDSTPRHPFKITNHTNNKG